jgi:hypothetical protein
MAVTVLSGTSGALYYKPANTLATFREANVTIGTETIAIAPYHNFRVGDPVRFRIVNPQTNATVTPDANNALPAGLAVNTTYFVVFRDAAAGQIRVSATAGGAAVDLTDDGTLAAPNEFEVSYATFAAVGQVRDWSFEITRSEIDVTTIGQTPGQYAPFRTYITGFSDGTGTATIYMTDEDAALSNRMLEDVLQNRQTGAAFKLYTDRVFVNNVLDDTVSRSISFDAVLTSASLNVNPDDAQSVTVNFRPSSSPAFDFAQT